MTVHWFYLLAAVLLLWFPRQWLRVGGRTFEFQRRSRRARSRAAVETVRDAHDSSVSFRVEIRKLRNHLDFARAALASVVLFGGLPGVDSVIEVAAWAPGATVRTAFYLRLAIVAVAVVIQSFRFEKRATLFAPIFFLSGLTVGVCGPVVAGFALVSIWALNSVLPNPSAFLLAYSLMIAGYGRIFPHLDGKLPVFMAAFAFGPVLASLLFRRQLALFSKRVKSTGEMAAPT